MTDLAGPWNLPHHPARTLLLFRGIYALLSFDAWTLMLEHGGRYGVGPFNVAHFDVLDRLVPMPSPGLYLALVTSAGLFAFAGAFGLLARSEALLLWALYTLSWMLSMHDSYQHHYLLSWLLGFGIFAPTLSVHACVGAGDRIRECSYPLALGCCTIVYLFTAISKSSNLWLSGGVLRTLAAEGGPMAWAPEALMRAGIANAEAWHFSAVATLLLQVVIALGFVAAFFRDAHGGRLPALLCTSALLAATSFHVATELSPSLAIGWFSYYMLWVAWVSLLPAAWLARLLAAFEALRTRLAWPRVWSFFSRADRLARTRLRMAAWTISVSASIAFAMSEVLPGVGFAALLFTCIVFVRAALTQRRDGLNAPKTALLPGVAIAALSLTLSLANVRFDYYRRAAGELSRMGRIGDALELYRRAEQCAPSGQSRRAKIEELEKRVSEQGE